MSLTTANSNCDITMQSANSGSVTRLRNGTNDFQIHTNGAERMRIDNGGVYCAADSTVNGAFHLKGAYQSVYNSTYLGSEYMARGLTGNVLHRYVHYDTSWNPSTETKNVFEVSHDSGNWGDKYIMIEVRQTAYSGGGYARYYLNHQYGQNSLVQFEKGGVNSGITAQMTPLTTVSGNIKKSTFQLVLGYYMEAIVTVTSTMTASTSITGQDQLRFL